MKTAPRLPLLLSLARVVLACAPATALAVDRAAAAEPAPSPDLLRLATCPRQAGEYRATFDDRMVLNRAFLDDKIPEDDQIREAAEVQIKYLWGYLRTRYEDPDRDRLVLSAEAPRIEIRSKSAGTYGRDLKLDWKEISDRLKITDPYTEKATRRGFAHASDPALVVEYRAHFKVAVCGAPRATESEIAFFLPADPWLLYWHVAAADRRVMRYHEVTARTNPCSDDDFADLPHPFYYWYDWEIDRHGSDEEHVSYDCRSLLKVNVDYHPRTVHLSRVGMAWGGASTSKDTADFSGLRKGLGAVETLTGTILIGVLDHAVTDLRFDEWLAFLDGGGGNGTINPARIRSLLGSDRVHERGTEKFLRLLSDLDNVMRPTAYRGSVERGYLRVDVTGTLRSSRRPIVLHAYVGPTDIFGPAPPAHWPILRKALATDHLLIYAGHSGIGENLRLAQIEKNLSLDHAKFAAELRGAPYQLIAFLSCYSYMYFGEDLVATARERTAADREFVYTGTEFTKGDRGALAILDLVDRVLAPQSPKSPKSGVSPSLRFVDPSDFLMLKAF